MSTSPNFLESHMVHGIDDNHLDSARVGVEMETDKMMQYSQLWIVVHFSEPDGAQYHECLYLTTVVKQLQLTEMFLRCEGLQRLEFPSDYAMNL